jgi:putative two-component system response regulator
MMPQQATILLVEDDLGFLSILEKTLKDAFPYKILTATDGVSALKLAEEHVPEVIISDYYMPVMDGFELCRAVKSHPVLRETMFMMLTSATEIDLKVKGFDSGADDYLTKPFLIEELFARIKALFRHKELHQELKAGKRELARLNAELEASFVGVVKILMDVIELKIPNAMARAERAAALSQWVGRRLECSPEELRTLEIAAWLHEIGKIRVADSALQKREEELTAVERETLLQFPIYGERILQTVPHLREVARVLRHQMENYDGTGFPDRLMKEEIPIFARIIRAINFLEWKIFKGVTETEALMDEVRKAKGLQLDPHIALLVEEYLRTVETPSWLEDKRAVTVYELTDGMVIATDLFTGNGVKLLSKDMKVTSLLIEHIIAHHQVDPIVNLIYVYR